MHFNVDPGSLTRYPHTVRDVRRWVFPELQSKPLSEFQNALREWLLCRVRDQRHNIHFSGVPVSV